MSESLLNLAVPDDDAGPIIESLRSMALVGTHTAFTIAPLEGGVSSAIYRADLPCGVVCVKRALPRLRVAADWRAPVERNHYEAEWLRVAGAIVPAAVPRLIAEDAAGGAFAMEWLDPARYPTWKTELREGRVSSVVAAQVGDTLGRIHAATADRADIASRFATDAIFEAIRIEPYLLATARVHLDLAPRLEALAERTRTTRRVLVHGDFSPKNLLIGTQGPVIVDAECAWFGDPAFDLAFVLNHLLLKKLWRPAHARAYGDAFAALRSAYLARVSWEPASRVDARAAGLVPGLMLARIDGKSPVEYLTRDADRDRVRVFARAQLVGAPDDTAALAARWFAEDA